MHYPPTEAMRYVDISMYVCIDMLFISIVRVIIWVWLKIKGLGLRRCWSLVPFTKVPFWYMLLSHSYMHIHSL